MHLIHALILGIIEGVTEFLPISSTGHLILASKILGLSETEVLKSFEIIIQLGAILAVVVLYFKKFFNWAVLKRLIIAFIPTGIAGLLAYKFFKEYLIASDTVVVMSLLLGGLFLIGFEMRHKQKIGAAEEVSEITYGQALLIGCFQALAIIPGVSRAAATVVGGLISGISRRTIVEFSFLLAVPTMIAASGLDLIKNYQNFDSGSVSVLGVGFVVSFIVAIMSIKWLLGYIQRHDFRPFGVYRVIVAILFWFLAK